MSLLELEPEVAHEVEPSVCCYKISGFYVIFLPVRIARVHPRADDYAKSVCKSLAHTAKPKSTKIAFKYPCN